MAKADDAVKEAVEFLLAHAQLGPRAYGTTPETEMAKQLLGALQDTTEHKTTAKTAPKGEVNG